MGTFIAEHQWVIILILLWTLPWKAVALWKSARRGHLGWFLVLIVLNTLAVLDIIYIYFFSKPRSKQSQPIEPQRRVPRFEQNQMGDENQADFSDPYYELRGTQQNEASRVRVMIN